MFNVYIQFYCQGFIITFVTITIIKVLNIFSLILVRVYFKYRKLGFYNHFSIIEITSYEYICLL